MADPLDLTHQDYRNFVQHCKECKSSLEIEIYINKKLAKYHNDNEDILQCLMEKVEELNLEGFDYGVGFDDDFWKREYLNFKEEAPDETHPQLRFLYSYICHLSDKDDEYRKVIAVPVNNGKATEPNNKPTSPKKISFGFIEKDKDRIRKIAFELTKDQDIHFLKSESMADLLAEVLTKRDLKEIDINKHIHFACDNSIINYVLASLSLRLNRKIHLKRVDDCLVFYSKNGTSLSSNSLYQAKKRNKSWTDTNTGIQKYIDDIINRYCK